MFTRRAFLERSTLLSLVPAMPGFLSRTAMAAPADRDGRVLVVVQLDGGNDGINTVVPYGDADYARHRKELRLPTDRLCKLTNHVGLHPSMRRGGGPGRGRPAGDRPGRGLPEPGSLAFPEHGDLADRPARRARAGGPRLAGPCARRRQGRRGRALGGVRRRPRPAARPARASDRDRIVRRSVRPRAGDPGDVGRGDASSGRRGPGRVRQSDGDGRLRDRRGAVGRREAEGCIRRRVTPTPSWAGTWS